MTLEAKISLDLSNLTAVPEEESQGYYIKIQAKLGSPIIDRTKAEIIAYVLNELFTREDEI